MAQINPLLLLAKLDVPERFRSIKRKIPPSLPPISDYFEPFAGQPIDLQRKLGDGSRLRVRR
jgi:hypothetical protein